MLRIVLTLVAALALAACSSERKDDAKTQVVASFYPVAFAAEQIGGPDVEVTDLVPAGVEPHDYELTVSDVKAIQDADVILYLGGGFQPSLEAALRSAPGKKIDVLEGIAVRNGDPHVWLDPTLYAQIATEIGAVLGEGASAGEFAGRLDDLGAEYDAGLRRCKRRVFITSHDAFGYLARANRLAQRPLAGTAGEDAVPARALGTFAHIARGNGDTTVFTEPLLPHDVAEVVAAEGGLELATLDPIEGATEGEDYFSLMRANLEALRKGLRCR